MDKLDSLLDAMGIDPVGGRSRFQREAHDRGLAIVPIKPTDEMIEAGAQAYESSIGDDLILPMEDAYEAMIAFAGESLVSPQQQAEGG